MRPAWTCGPSRALVAGFLLFLVAVHAAPVAVAAPEQVHLSLVDDAVGVAWIRPTRDDASPDQVEWTWDGSPAQVADAATRDSIAPGATVFTATLPVEGRMLTYRVGHGDDWTGWKDAVLSPAGDEPWRFAVYGDQGTGADSNMSEALVPAVAAWRPHAVLHVGDISYANADPAVWDTWFRMVEPLASSTYYMAAPGNHEHEGYYPVTTPGLDNAENAWDTDAVTDPYRQFRARFQFPDASPAPELWYTFRLGPVHVVVMNTEDTCWEQPVHHYVPWRANPVCDPLTTGSGGAVDQPTLPNQALLSWLDGALAAGHDAPWTVVMMHQPAYSAGAYTGQRVLRDHFVPLFDAHGVDLVLAGHDHNYQRSFPLAGHAAVTEAATGYLPDTAPVYVVSGGGGEGLYSFRDEGVPAWTAARAGAYHFVILEASETHLAVTAIGTANGTVLDTFTIGTPPDAAAVETPAPAAAAFLATAAAAAAFRVRRGRRPA